MQIPELSLQCPPQSPVPNAANLQVKYSTATPVTLPTIRALPCRCHCPPPPARSAPHVPVRSYHKFQVDIALLRAMNVSNFRVSVAWSRVILDDGSVNQLGVQHYTNVFKVFARIHLHVFVRRPAATAHKRLQSMIAAGIKPWVTLYHWDLPSSLQDAGGKAISLLTTTRRCADRAPVQVGPIHLR